ncbi:MAG: hypothetical protein ACPGSM_22635 [Thiolinea sp.]
MKRIVSITVALLGMSLMSGAIAEDKRQLLNFPPMMRDHMLQNMRDHLMALQEIQAFMAVSEYEKAADVAETRLGMSSLDNHGASHMAQMMPKPMQDIGTAMHKAASRFAVTIQEISVDDSDLRPALKGLAEITQQCVACHAAYRVH